MLEEARGSEVLRKAHPLPCTSTSILLGGDDKRTKAHVPGTNNVATMRTFIDLLPGFDKRAPNAFRTRAVGNTRLRVLDLWRSLYQYQQAGVA